ncbi:MAG TPA: hypothetical protein VGW10_06890 [Solirubrobacteraceae bacterium]|nr:hypothetical protein [Solirubrobacteraceae bacterium]
MTRWQRTIAAGTLLEVSFESARADPPQALVLEVDRGRLAWDEQGEEGPALRVWADRHEVVVLRLTGRFARVGLSVWHAYLDADEIDGEVVRLGDGMRVEEQPGWAMLRCGDDLVARIGIHARSPHRARASSE